ncbi:hypothetical protein [Halorubellus litoreus]|uniref:Uncharacterized protein n=1 Tax=Halorubellus litoreus TaxID=755308 RepID=A0ABD5VLJ7_9EURY
MLEWGCWKDGLVVPLEGICVSLGGGIGRGKGGDAVFGWCTMRSLVIGADVGGATASRRWTEEYNLLDYEVVFANLCDLVGNSQVTAPGSAPSNAVSFPDSGDISELVEAGNWLFVLMPGQRTVDLRYVSTSDDTEMREVDLLSWLPLDISLAADSGESVDSGSVASDWEWYFGESFQRAYTIEKVGPARGDEQPSFAEVFMSKGASEQALARTVAGATIACTVDMTPMRETVTAVASESREQLWDGRIGLVPVAGDWTPSDVIAGTLEHQFGVTTERDLTRPAWVESVQLDGEQAVQERLESVYADYEVVQQAKELLWASGEKLETLVAWAFEELGSELVMTAGDGEWDAELAGEDRDYIFEITGQNDAIAIEKVRQLKDWEERAQTAGFDNEVQMVLVAATHREAVPGERPQPLTEAARDFCATHGYWYLDTRDLAAAVTHSVSPERRELSGEGLVAEHAWRVGGD